MTAVTDYTALISGDSWNGLEITNKPAVVTFSFATAAPAADATTLGATAYATFQPMTAAQQAQIISALNEWGSASGLTFVQVPAGASDITFSSYNFTGSAYAGAGGVGFYPFGDWNFYSQPNFFDGWNGAGNVLMNTAFESGGLFNYSTVLHEIGHALGLKHPTEDFNNFASGVDHNQVLASDDGTATVMTEQANSLQHLTALDIAAAQSMYGTNAMDGSEYASWSYNSAANSFTFNALAAGGFVRGSAVNDTMNGSSHADTMVGLYGDDSLSGNDGNDSLFGGSGNDTLDGGTGIDTMYGGKGDDAYYVDNASDQVVEFSGEGNDTVSSTVSYTLGDNVENLLLQGSANLNGTGNALDNYIGGNSGNNLLSGLDGNDVLVDLAGGTDTLLGGNGDDLISVSSSGDSIDGGAGIDTFRLYVTSNLSGLNYDAIAASTATGMTMADGTHVQNVEHLLQLNTGSGDDTLTISGAQGPFNWYAGTGVNTLILDDSLETHSVLMSATGIRSLITGIAYQFLISENGVNSLVDSVSVVNLTGGSGDDSLCGTDRNDTIDGGAGKDTLTGGIGNDSLHGGAGNDRLDGGSGADTMYGGSGNDTYFVDNPGDVVSETSTPSVDDGGIDTVHSTIGFTLPDFVENLSMDGAANGNATGNALDNSVKGNLGDNLLSGLAGNDALTDYYGADTFLGGAGNDYIWAGAGVGADSIDGGDGNDTVSLERTDSTTNLAFDMSAARTSTGFDLGDGTIIKNVENLNTLITGSGNDVLHMTGDQQTFYWSAGAGNDTLELDGSNLPIGMSFNLSDDSTGGYDLFVQTSSVPTVPPQGGGADEAFNVEAFSLVGSLAADTLYTLDVPVTFNGSAGNDSLWGGTGNDHLDGSYDNDLISGGGGMDLLIGGLGNDTLSGDGVLGNLNSTIGGGADTLYGGPGDDIYYIDNTADVVSEQTTPGTDDGGLDIVFSTASFTLPGYVEKLTLQGTGNLSGTGNSLDNVVYGNNGDNLLGGLDGNDTIRGFDGNDTLHGGNGNDYIEGNNGTDLLYGDAGNDTLVSSIGNDALYGGAGNDVYIVNDAGTVVSEESTGAGIDDGGIDQVNAAIGFTLGTFIENLTLTGGNAINGAGNSLANLIYGNSGANALSGLDGDDTLRGFDGNDTIHGGNGNDSLEGGNGDDQLFGDAGNDILTDSAGHDTLYGGAGNDTYYVNSALTVVSEESTGSGINDGGSDTVYAGVDYTLGNFIERLQLQGSANISGTGNALANVVYGNGGSNVLNGLDGSDTLRGFDGNDTLHGGNANDYLDGGNGTDQLFGDAGNDTLMSSTGNDTLYGGAGDDIYYINDATDVTSEETAGAGIDDGGTDVILNTVSATMGAFIEKMYLQGTNSINGAGNAQADLIYGNSGNNSLSGLDGNDTLRGFDGNDTLHGGNDSDFLDGGNGADVLYGDAGNDSLNSSLGGDTLYGGAGNDVYYVDYAGTVASEESSGAGIDDGGIDQVNASINVTLGNFIENLTLTGGNAINGTGNSLDNLVYGNSGNNSLSGADGNDTMRGFDGNDTIHGGNGNDSLEGGNGDDKLFGDAGNDILTDSTGHDTLYGGAGNDVYYVTSANTLVSEEQAGAGIDDGGSDTVNAGVDYTLGTFIERLQLTGSADLHGAGNALDNVVYGNSGNNVLSGLDGNDTIRGFDGNDSLIGGNGNDYFEGGNGNDTIVGGAGNDTLYGNAGADSFVFGAAGSANGADVIGDFAHGTDQLLFTGTDYGFTAGHALTAAEFTAGTAAAGSNAQFIWNATTHTLYWDDDGAGSHAAIAIASFLGGATLDASDFHFS